MAVRRNSYNLNISEKLTGWLFSHNLPLLLLLLISTATTIASGAVLPPNSVRSASASQSTANQRSERSATALLEDTSGSRRSTDSGDGGSDSRAVSRGAEGGDAEKRMAGNVNAGCSSDFVENFFRLLSGPVGKEAEALVAAVLKLISENDRVNWPALAATAAAATTTTTAVDGDVSPSPSSSAAYAAPPRGGGGGGVFRARPALFGLTGPRSEPGSKRGAPKFNPTGWRRKRSASYLPYPVAAPPPRQPQPPQYPVAEAALQQLLLRSLARSAAAAAAASEQQRDRSLGLPPKIFELGDEGDVDDGELALQDWRNKMKRDGLETVLLRRRQLKPKRKPLEFNPTGW